jgi:hypothetical protein
VDGRKALVISCDLLGVTAAITARVRQIIGSQAGLDAGAVMVHAIHSHSGPTTDYDLIGWGEPDAPYIETLPQRIARAGLDALANLRPATLSHAEAPCEGIGYNREYDGGPRPLAEVLQDDWRPSKPELTDTKCHVLVARRPNGSPLGFASSFGCHPVCCCEETRAIHGDFAGVATNSLEREHPGTIGLFLQGAQGDVNSCVAHKPEPESLLALDVIAARYANAVRRGIAEAASIAVESVGCTLHEVAFPRRRMGAAKLRALLAEREAVLTAPGASDASSEVRMATVHARALRRLLGSLAAGDSLEPATDLQGFRIGPIALLAAPFEIFQAIKNDVVARSPFPVTLVLGITNDTLGYAPDHEAAARGGYAADTVPIILGQLPFWNLHQELRRSLLDLARALE